MTQQLEDVAAIYAAYGKKDGATRATAAPAWLNSSGKANSSSNTIANLLHFVKGEI